MLQVPEEQSPHYVGTSVASRCKQAAQVAKWGFLNVHLTLALKLKFAAANPSVRARVEVEFMPLLCALLKNHSAFSLWQSCQMGGVLFFLRMNLFSLAREIKAYQVTPQPNLLVSQPESVQWGLKPSLHSNLKNCKLGTNCALKQHDGNCSFLQSPDTMRDKGWSHANDLEWSPHINTAISL